MMYSLSIKALGDALIFTIWPLVVKNKDQLKYTSRPFVSLYLLIDFYQLMIIYEVKYICWHLLIKWNLFDSWYLFFCSWHLANHYSWVRFLAFSNIYILTGGRSATVGQWRRPGDVDGLQLSAGQKSGRTTLICLIHYDLS